MGTEGTAAQMSKWLVVYRVVDLEVGSAYFIFMVRPPVLQRLVRISSQFECKMNEVLGNSFQSENSEFHEMNAGFSGCTHIR